MKEKEFFYLGRINKFRVYHSMSLRPRLREAVEKRRNLTLLIGQLIDFTMA